MRNIRAIHEDEEKTAEKDKAEVLARVAEAQAQVKKWMQEFDEQDSKRLQALDGGLISKSSANLVFEAEARKEMEQDSKRVKKLGGSGSTIRKGGGGG